MRSAVWLLAGIGVAAAACTDSPVKFENLRIEEIGPYRAVIRFDTSRETRCHIEYGASPDTMTTSATDPNMKPGTYVVHHHVPLEDLPPSSDFYFVAVATDHDGNEYRSEVDHFTTAPGVPVDSLPDVALATAGTTIAAVSSNWSNESNSDPWGADHVIDGLMASEWSSNMDGDNAFVELDLGQPRAVSFIGFRSRKMDDGTSIVKQFQLVVDGQTTLGPYDTPDPDVRYVIPLPAPQTMRLVRMQALQTTGGNTGLKELQLFTSQP